MGITTTTGTEHGLDYTEWTLTVDGTTVASLSAHTASGLILNVEVDAAHRGEGHARSLYEHADSTLGLYHVPSWGRTEDGDGFADAMGGPVMNDQEACDILGLNLDLVTGACFAG